MRRAVFVVKEKIPGKGFTLAGAIVAVVAGVIMLVTTLSQMSDIKGLLAMGLLPDSVHTILNISMFLDPLRGIVAVATAVVAFLCITAPRKWITPAIIVSIVLAVLEFIGIILYAYMSSELGSTGRIQYSLALIGALLVIVGLSKMKTSIKQEKATV